MAGSDFVGPFHRQNRTEQSKASHIDISISTTQDAVLSRDSNIPDKELEGALSNLMNKVKHIAVCVFGACMPPDPDLTLPLL